MAGENRRVHASRESDTPTRRRFLEAAGIAAAGAALANPSKSSASGLSTHNHNPRPTCVAVTADPTKAVTCDDNGVTTLWNITDPTNPILDKAFLTKVGKKASNLAVSKPQPGNFTGIVLTAGFDGHVLVHDLNATATDKPLRDFDHHVRTDLGGSAKCQVWAVAITTNGTHAISGTNGGEIRIWNPKGDNNSSNSIAVAATDEPVASLAFVPQDDNSIMFLAGYGDGKMDLWTYADGVFTRDPDFYDHETALPVNSIGVYKGPAPAIPIAVTGSFDSNVRIWNVGKGLGKNQKPKINKSHNHFIWRVAISSGGDTIAAVGEDGQVVFLDKTGKEISRKKKTHGVMGVDFIDNSKVVVAKGQLDPFGANVEALNP